MSRIHRAAHFFGGAEEAPGLFHYGTNLCPIGLWFAAEIPYSLIVIAHT